MLKVFLQEISENYLRVTPIRSVDYVIIISGLLFVVWKAGKQGGTALIRPMHYGYVVYGIF